MRWLRFPYLIAGTIFSLMYVFIGQSELMAFLAISSLIMACYMKI